MGGFTTDLYSYLKCLLDGDVEECFSDEADFTLGFIYGFTNVFTKFLIGAKYSSKIMFFDSIFVIFISKTIYVIRIDESTEFYHLL